MISPLFKVHELNDEGIDKATRIAVAFDTFLGELEYLCAGSSGLPTREFSIVRTKL